MKTYKTYIDMRKYVLALVLFLFIGNTCLMAQNKQDRRMPDKSEIIQKRTDRMAERYGLDENQAKALLELNKQYADKMFMGGRPGRGNGPRRAISGDSVSMRKRPDKSQIEEMMKKMTETREAYNNSLKKIMNDSQFSKYEEDQKKMMQRRLRNNNRGNR